MYYSLANMPLAGTEVSLHHNCLSLCSQPAQDSSSFSSYQWRQQNELGSTEWISDLMSQVLTLAAPGKRRQNL